MTIRIALVGNPEGGLTTLFNQLTGGRTCSSQTAASERKRKEGPAKNVKGVNLIQLPGTYSLSVYSPEDRFTQDFLLYNKPDAIIHVADITSFERSLSLTLQLTELDIPLVLALNMMDEAENNQFKVNIKALSQTLGIPVLPISSRKYRDAGALLHCTLETVALNHTVPSVDFYTGYARTTLHMAKGIISKDAQKAGLPLSFCCTRIMEGDAFIPDMLCLSPAKRKIMENLLKDMEAHLKEERETAIATMRYLYLHKLYKSTVTAHPYCTKEQKRSYKIDSFLTHKILAIPIFCAIMLTIFHLTFHSIGGWLSGWLAAGITQLTEKISYGLLDAGVNPAFHSLVVDGICAGVGSVLSFLPIIAVLFFFLSILEESGYMLRVAFVMDKLLQKIGLSGKAVVPMLIGFGCSVPAIMAARSLPGERDRRLTITLIPFLSCSAKLPVYAMFTAVFFAENKALIMAGLYAAGILIAILCALILKKTIFQGEPEPFLLVLPPYRIPRLKNTLLCMWENAGGFVKKAFTVIFLASIVIWFLQNFNMEMQMTDNREASILAAIGKTAAPIFAPLGFGDWRAATALLTGASAKEAIVSTLAILTGSAKGYWPSETLSTIFTPLSAFSFLVFCLLYIPCIAALSAIRKEMGGWHYVVRTAIFQCTIAWMVSFFLFQIGSFFSGIFF